MDGDQAPTSGARVGDRAPDFTLPNQSGELIRLSDYIGKRVIVLYFYPKDQTRGCTAEACAFRDSYQDFTDAGAEVIGISSDSVSSHEQFASQLHLPFILVSDSGGAVRKVYGIPNTLGLWPGRVTYVIDKRGIIRHIFSSATQIDKHISEAAQTVHQLQTEQG